MPVTETPEIVWDGDVPVLVEPDSHPCDNPFDWTPVHMDDVPVEDES